MHILHTVLYIFPKVLTDKENLDNSFPVCLATKQQEHCFLFILKQNSAKLATKKRNVNFNPLTPRSNLSFSLLSIIQLLQLHSENLALDQLIILKLIFFVILITYLVDVVVDIVRRNSVLVSQGS